MGHTKKITSLILTISILCLTLSGCEGGGIVTDGTVPAPKLFEIISDSAPSDRAGVRISEVMSGNTAFYMVRDGVFPDWIELENTGEEAAELSGCYLSDDETDPRKWAIGSLTLAPGERRVIYCAGEDAREGEASFSISSAEGEVITLSDPQGRVVDSLVLPPARENVSFIRDGEGVKECLYPTPGYENTEQGYLDYCAGLDAPESGLVISEAVLYNLDYEKQNGEFYDWAELKNTSKATLNLSGYSLCDTLEGSYRYELPAIELLPGEKQVIFLSGDESLGFGSYFHAGFALSSEGEGLFLCAPDGRVADYAAISAQPYCGSVGRLDGRGGLFRFDTPSPGEDNTDGCRTVSAAPGSSMEQGVYNGAGRLKIELSGEGDIFYTLDGSRPTAQSERYTKPFTVSENTVIRAACRTEGRCLSDPETFSYIINENDTMPVVSLVCDPEGMFGGGGVYNSARGVDPVIDGDVTLFEPGGGGFSSGCTIELHGARSREIFLKKSFKLTFSSRLGGDVHYDIFGDGRVTDFHSILLRGGAIVDLGLTCDSFAATLMNQVCPDTYVLNTRYAVVYINGEYRGIYAIREAYSGEYFESHTGARAGDVQISRSPADVDELSTLLGLLSNMELRYQENYEWCKERLDLASLARWMAAEAYFSNQDIGGNIRYVKLSEDSPWRMVLYDLDYSVLQIAPDWGVAVGAFQIGPVINRLLENGEFRQLLLEETAKMYREGLQTENVLKTYDELCAQIDDASAQKESDRWFSELSKWHEVRGNMRANLCEPRMALFLSQLQELTGADDGEMERLFGDYPRI